MSERRNGITIRLPSELPTYRIKDLRPGQFFRFLGDYRPPGSETGGIYACMYADPEAGADTVHFIAVDSPRCDWIWTDRWLDVEVEILPPGTTIEIILG